MPTYEYCCATCGYDFEARQKFQDEPLTVCPKCGSALHKVFSSVGVVFKGSGFYSTDNHSSAKPAAHQPEKTEKASPAASETAAPAPAKTSS